MVRVVKRVMQQNLQWDGHSKFQIMLFWDSNHGIVN